MIYCVSDIHGHYDEFMMMLEKIHFGNQDHMYVIGDVCDKGLYSIKIYQFLENDPRFTFIMGNHDYMFYRFIKALKERDTDTLLEYRFQWIEWNFGRRTFEEYKQLSENEQDKLYAFLHDAYLDIPALYVNGKIYRLVHAYPGIKDAKEPVLFKDEENNEDIVLDYVWARDKAWDGFKEQIIYGHTINESGYIENHGNHVDIDCGCAMNVRLACLRLDDMTEFYIDCKKGSSIFYGAL